MADRKIIINVGRQLGSGGHDIAKMLAKDFGCTMYDRELLDLAAKESGFSKKFFEQNDEQKGFLKSLFHMHMPLVSDSSFYNHAFSQEGLFLFQSDAIKKAAEAGPAVFVGRCADYVLRDYPDTVSVFITADMSDRIERVSRRHLCDNATAAKIIENQEKVRSSYYNYYTGKKWGHSSSYDLCINSSLLGFEGTEAFIKSFIRQRLGID